MTDKLNIDTELHNLHLGKSFDSNAGLAFHSMRYDFKPHSLDLSKTASVDVGPGHSICVKVPHVAGSSTTHTEYRGNKRPCHKECVLIIDHVTGEFTLEKLTFNMQLKSTRTKGANKSAPVSAPVIEPSNATISNKVSSTRPPPNKKLKESNNNETVIKETDKLTTRSAASKVETKLVVQAGGEVTEPMITKNSLTDDEGSESEKEDNSSSSSSSTSSSDTSDDDDSEQEKSTATRKRVWNPQTAPAGAKPTALIPPAPTAAAAATPTPATVQHANLRSFLTGAKPTALIPPAPTAAAAATPTPATVQHANLRSFLSEDLRLSESDSD